MKLATFRHEGKKSAGLMLDAPVLALSAARPRDTIGLPRAGGPVLQASAVSISLWIVVVFFGRWIGFTT